MFQKVYFKLHYGDKVLLLRCRSSSKSTFNYSFDEFLKPSCYQLQTSTLVNFTLKFRSSLAKLGIANELRNRSQRPKLCEIHCKAAFFGEEQEDESMKCGVLCKIEDTFPPKDIRFLLFSSCFWQMIQPLWLFRTNKSSANKV